MSNLVLSSLPKHEEPFKTDSILEYSDKYKVTKNKIRVNELNSRTCVFLNRRIYNFTSMYNIHVIDGSTGYMVSVLPNTNHCFIDNCVVVETTSELMSYQEFNSINKDRSRQINGVAYTVSEEELKNNPVYIAELNIIITTDEYVDKVPVPNPKMFLEEQKLETEQTLKKFMSNLASEIYVRIPSNYQGSRLFYTILNGTIVKVPVIDVKTNLENIEFVIRMKNAVTNRVEESVFKLDHSKLSDCIPVMTDNFTWYIGTSVDNVLAKFNDSKYKAVKDIDNAKKKCEEQLASNEEKCKKLETELSHKTEQLKKVEDILSTQKLIEENKRKQAEKNKESAYFVVKAIGAIAPIITAIVALFKLFKQRK